MTTVQVTPVVTATVELLDAFHSLIPQLSTSSSPITMAELREIVGDSATVVFVARDGGVIVGLLTLAMFRIPTGMRAWIEDVVVDGRARGKGVGEALNRAALATARQRGAKTVDLTRVQAAKRRIACISALDLSDVTPMSTVTSYDDSHGVS